MNLFFYGIFILSSVALALDNQYSQQRKIKCTIKTQQDIHRLHTLRRSSAVDLWDESIDALPSLVTMRIHQDILSFIQKTFSCAPPEKIFLPIEKKVLSRKSVNPNDFFNDYRSHEQIINFVNTLTTRNPQRVLQIESMGKSGEGREMPVVTLGKHNLLPKKNLWVNGGQHAREWIAPAACLYLIDKIIRANDPILDKLLDKFNVVVAPLINPDGYEYSRNTDRMWRKNRTLNPDGSFGTDLNRNWGAEWGFIGTTKDPRSDIFCGSSAESEPEVRNMAKYVLAIPNRVAGLDVHSYGQKILRNYGYTMSNTKDEAHVSPIGSNMAVLATRRYQKTYISQKSAALYPTGGGLDDWFYIKAGMYGFTVELRDDGSFGFLLPAAQIRQTGDELVEIVKGLLSRL